MTQRTIVLKLEPQAGPQLLQRLRGGDFAFRDVPHAVFSARGEGVTATLYASGKLVVQGPEPEVFLARYADQPGDGHAAPRGGDDFAPVEGHTLVGSDESGKGDYFGPLVVAAVRLTPEQARGLEGGEIVDSKRIADETVLRLGAALRGSVPYAIARLDPPEYNDLHATAGNLNPMLADLHAQAIRELYEPGIHVLVDRFAAEAVMEQALSGLDVHLHQRTRAERNVVVAAASVIAREAFLVELRRLSDEFAIELNKGAGAPTDKAARRFVALHGVEKLGSVAKLHFRNTSKLRLR